MSERYGPLRLFFVEWDDPDNELISYNGVNYLEGVVSAEVTRRMGQMTRGRARFLKSGGWEEYAQKGRIVGMAQTNGVRTAWYMPSYREMGSFVVESITEGLDQSGREWVEIAGLGVEHLLTKIRHWRPIGEETIYNRELAAGAPAPWTTTVQGGGVPSGNDSIILDSDAGVQVGDEIRVEMDAGGWYVGTVTGVGTPLPSNQIQFTPRIPGVASADNDVEFRRAILKLDSIDELMAGQRVVVTLNSGTHASVVTGVKAADVTVALRDGLTGAAAAGKAVDVYDYTQPATDDVWQIMQPLIGRGWMEISATHGTVAGTSHAPYGESTWDLLTATAAQTGESFRSDGLINGYRPQKRIVWYNSAPSSSVTLYLRDSQTTLASDVENVTRGVVLALEREETQDIITRVFPLTGDGRISLGYCSAAALSEAAAAGYTVVISDDLYIPDYVESTAGRATYGIQAATFRYGDVTLAAKALLNELQAASDRMLRQAMAMIAESQTREYLSADVRTHEPLYAGQKITLINSTGLGPQTSQTYIIQSVIERYDGAGIIKTRVHMSIEPALRPTAVRQLGRMLLANEQAARRASVTPGGSGPIVIGGGGGGATDHGDLTGLLNDGHPQYLPVAGTRGMVGNLTMAAGKTVDGVDISAHAADDSAHHAPVTAGDNSINVSGQAVSVKRPANSGVKVDAGGVYLNPSTLTASTTNAVSGDGHTHAITTTANAKTTPNTILKGDGNGDLTARYYIGDKVTTPVIDTNSGSLLFSPASKEAIIDGDLTIYGQRTITTNLTNELTLAPGGSLTINPANNVLKVGATTEIATANAAVGAFPQTGWKIGYDGKAYFTGLTADELAVQSFTADTFRVKMGAEYITKSMAELSRSLTVPAIDTSVIMYVWDAPGFDNAAVFTDGDWVLLRVNTAATGLSVGNVWGQVYNYTDQANGEQRWTFTSRVLGAGTLGKVAPTGLVVLDYGKSGDGWWYASALDAGGAHAGVGTWQGSNPTSGVQHMVRLGQLKGVSGRNEYGFQAGTTNSAYMRMSQLGTEIHGARLSLYSSDNAQLRVAAVSVIHWRAPSLSTTLVANTDHTVTNVLSTAGNYWSTIDDSTGLPNYTDYVRNADSASGVLFVGLTNPTWGLQTTKVDVAVVTEGSAFVYDTVRLYGQVFQSDEITPLTAEALLRTQTNNTKNTATVTLPQHVATATQAQWNDARLRLRWEYEASTGVEAIRLDPNVPSLAVGAPLPTGYDTGGDGVWVGPDAGTYKMRLGKASGVGLRWDGSTLAIRNSDNQNVIELKSDGTSSFARPISLGTNGGIWQGSSGTFASPSGALKIWNESGEGRLALFDSFGTQRVTLRHDRGIEIVNSGGFDKSSAINFAITAGGGTYGGLQVQNKDGFSQFRLMVEQDSPAGGSGILGWRSSFSSEIELFSMDVLLSLNSTDKYLLLSSSHSYPSFYINRGGIGVGYDPNNLPAIPVGVIASDLAGEHDGPQLILQDTVDIAHGMTSIASTSTYANFGKLYNDNGGLLIRGLTETVVGVNIAGYGTTTNTATSTAAIGAVHVSAFKKSGTGVTSYGNSDNIFVVRNNLDTKFIVKGNGNFHYDGTGAAYDDHDDVGLLRTLAREMWAGTVDGVWDKFVTANRQNLIDADIISDGGFINGAALNRLLTGAIWQLNERLAALEGRAS